MLEEYGKYESTQGKKIHLASAIDHQQMILYHGSEILKTLWIDLPWREEMQEQLKSEKVIEGLTDDLSMPSGYRHQKSGKCLWGNTPMPTHSEKYEPYLAKFDIKTE